MRRFQVTIWNIRIMQSCSPLSCILFRKVQLHCVDICMTLLKAALHHARVWKAARQSTDLTHRAPCEPQKASAPQAQETEPCSCPAEQITFFLSYRIKSPEVVEFADLARVTVPNVATENIEAARQGSSTMERTSRWAWSDWLRSQPRTSSELHHGHVLQSYLFFAQATVKHQEAFIPGAFHNNSDVTHARCWCPFADIYGTSCPSHADLCQA